MFRGTYEHTLDKKGRVSVPSRFREILLGSQEKVEVMLTRGLGNFLMLFNHG